MEEAWERHERRSGALAELARLRAEAGLVELRDPHGEGVTCKPMEDLTREERPARVAAERARAAWLKERHERRSGALASMGGERLRFEEERARFLAAELLEGARAQEHRPRVARPRRPYHGRGPPVSPAL